MVPLRRRMLIPHRSVPILAYHQIAEPSADRDSQRHAVSPAAFARQMGYLKARGYEAITLDDLVRPREQRRLPRRPIVITFDDGYLDAYESAWPILRQFGFKATIFLIADFVGREHAWRNGQSVPYLTWAQAREMADDCFCFESHTCGHGDLTTLPPEQLRDELSRSKATIEEGLGRPVNHISYPFGHYDERVKTMVRETGYHAGFAVSRGGADQYEIERQMVFRRDGDRMFRLKVSGWGDWVRAVRHAIREPEYEV